MYWNWALLPQDVIAAFKSGAFYSAICILNLDYLGGAFNGHE